MKKKEGGGEEEIEPRANITESAHMYTQCSRKLRPLSSPALDRRSIREADAGGSFAIAAVAVNYGASAFFWL